MQLTKFTEYSLRLLVYLAHEAEPEKRYSLEFISEEINVTKNHLAKIAKNLVNAGYIQSSQGRTGGLWLERDPTTIKLGDVIMVTEDTPYRINCSELRCPLRRYCSLSDLIFEAQMEFVNKMNETTLKDVIHK